MPDEEWFALRGGVKRRCANPERVEEHFPRESREVTESSFQVILK